MALPSAELDEMFVAKKHPFPPKYFLLCINSFMPQSEIIHLKLLAATGFLT